MTNVQTDFFQEDAIKSTARERVSPTAGVAKKTISAQKDVLEECAKKYVGTEFVRATSYVMVSTMR